MCNPSVSPEGKEMETSDKTKDYHTQNKLLQKCIGISTSKDRKPLAILKAIFPAQFHLSIFQKSQELVLSSTSTYNC